MAPCIYVTVDFCVSRNITAQQYWMVSLWSRLALSLVLLSIVQLLLVCADYEVQVAVHSYRNPSHRHAGGDCCDVTVVGFILFFPIFGCGDCDNYFFFCLRTPGATQDCPLGELHSGEVGGDSLTFNPGVKGNFGHLTNPLHFTNSGNWSGSFELVIDVNDDDDVFPATLNGDEFVDVITITRSLAVGDSFTGKETYSGENGRGTIVLSFRVVCTGNFYGPDCGTLCVPQDSSSGHYTCDSQGNRVCLDGYKDPASNCTQCLPSEGCLTDACGQGNPCQNGGSCETDALGNASCSCALGFMGPSCEVPTSETTPTATETTPTDNDTTATDETTHTDHEATATDETTPTDNETTHTDNEATNETTPTDDSTATDEVTATDETIPTDDTTAIDETTPTDNEAIATDETTPIDNETTPTSQTTPTDTPDDPFTSMPIDEATPTDVGESQPAILPAETPGSLDPTLLPGGRSIQQSTSGVGAGVLAAAVAVPLLVVLLSVVVLVTLVLVCLRRRRKWRFPGEVTTTLLDAADAQTSPPHAPRENPMYIPSTMGMVVTSSNSATSTEHEFDNPLYSEHSRTQLSTSYASIHDDQFATAERPYVTDTLSSASSVDFKFNNPLYSERNGTPPSASYASIHDNRPATAERSYVTDTLSSASSVDFKFNNPLYSEHNGTPPSASYASIHDNRPVTTERAYSTSRRLPLTSSMSSSLAVDHQATPEGQYTSPYVSMSAEDN